MLLLIRADRHKIGLIQQDVGSHQHGVGEEASVDVVGMLRALILELRHTAELTHIGVTIQNPGQLRVGTDMALAVKNAFLRINAAGQIQRCQFQTAAAQIRRVLPDGDGMLIHHAVKAIVGILQFCKAAQRTDIIAQGQRAAGLYAGKNDRFAFLFHMHPSFGAPGKRRLFFYCC